MSKEIKSNTFNKGLMMDLHPINTPNSVLTDNLNGTIITYDGNEHVLQNDMGNYKLKDCQLRSNYIPIGLKEHAGILYIVSYNPLDESVEIGTYPSPEIKTPSSYPYGDKSLDVFKELKGKHLYSELEKPQSVIWYDEKLKINPGDYYKITTNEFDDLRIIKNAWSIMTDDKILYEVDIEQNSNDYVPVTWEYPGYLTFQQKIVTPTEFEAFVSQLNIPGYIESEDSNLSDITDGKIGFEMSLSRLDYDRITKGKTLKDVIDVDVIVTKVKQDGTKEILNVRWNKEEKFTIYDFGESEINIFGLLDLDSSISGLKKSDTLIFETTPIFKDENFSIVFDQYKTSAIVTLNKVGTVNDIEIGSEVYKFWRQGDVCYVIFDILSPILVAGDVHLWYRLVDLDEKVVLEWTKIEDEILSGQNMLSLNLSNEQKEQIYILEFCFGEPEQNKTIFNKPKFKKLLITSIVFQEFINEKNVFDQEILFSDWYKLHNKYVNYKNEDFKIKFDTDDYSFTCDEEKTITNVINEKYWNTVVDDCYNYSYTLAIKDEDDIPKLSYSYGYLQKDIPVTGDITELNENLLNIGIWKIPEEDIFIKVGDEEIECNLDGTFSESIDCVLGKNITFDTEIEGYGSIPSVDKIFVNENLQIEKTEGKIEMIDGVMTQYFEKTILENQQLFGHQYGAGGSNSGEKKRKYDYVAETLASKIFMVSSKLASSLSIAKSVTRIALITSTSITILNGIATATLYLCSVPILNIIMLAFTILAAIVTAILAMVNWVGDWFNTERHLSWASSLYSTKLESYDEINVNNETETTLIESFNLELIGRKQDIQWQAKEDDLTGLQDMTQSFLHKNKAIGIDNKKYKILNNNNYCCFPVLFQNYVAANNWWIAKDGICIYKGDESYFIEQSKFDTQYSVWIAFMTPSDKNSLVYIPCTFDGFVYNTIKVGSISDCVDSNNGELLSDSDEVVENNINTVTDVIKMVSSAAVWCKNLFVIPTECEFVDAEFRKPIIPEYQSNIAILVEYCCEFDYTKTKYLNKTLTDKNRIDNYSLTDKVDNLSLMSGDCDKLETIKISGVLHKDVENYDINTTVDEKLNQVINEYKKFIEYCEAQRISIKSDPVVMENSSRNGKCKGVYNLVDQYSSDGGVLFELNKRDPSTIITYPTTDSFIRYYTCSRDNGNIGVKSNRMYVTLGYDSKLTIDCTDLFNDINVMLNNDTNS